MCVYMCIGLYAYLGMYMHVFTHVYVHTHIFNNKKDIMNFSENVLKVASEELGEERREENDVIIVSKNLEKNIKMKKVRNNTFLEY